MSLLALDKWSKLFKMIAQNGGLFKSLYKIWRYDTLKLDPQLKGCDALGNRYYENTYYMLGRSRWVEYADNVRWEYDASQVSPEWYGWLHYKTDCLPHEDCAKYCIACCAWYHKWMLPPEENLTGTELAYYPYSTVRGHILPWDVSVAKGPYKPVVGGDLSLPSVINAMLSSERSWQAVVSFCEDVILQKEMADGNSICSRNVCPKKG